MEDDDDDDDEDANEDEDEEWGCNYNYDYSDDEHNDELDESDRVTCRFMRGIVEPNELSGSVGNECSFDLCFYNY